MKRMKKLLEENEKKERMNIEKKQRIEKVKQKVRNFEKDGIRDTADRDSGKSGRRLARHV